MIEFLKENWIWIAPVILELASRLIPSEKNYSLVENLVKIFGKVLPNLKKGGGKHVN